MGKDFLGQLSDIYERVDKEIITLGIGTKSNFCGSCTRCCHYLYRFPVSSIEISFVYESYGNFHNAVEFTDFLNGRLKNPDGSKSRCPYSDEKGCKIYEARPMCCRLYGLSPYRPLIEKCVFNDMKEKAHDLWRALTPLFKEFIDMRFDYYRTNKDTFTPSTITDFLDLGSIRIMEKDFEKAAADFEEALAINPGDPISHSYMGWLCELKGDMPGALEKYRYCISIDPYDYTTHLKTGLLLHGEGRLEEARHYYEKTLEIDPFNAQAWGNLGLIHISMEQWEEAADAYHRAIQLEPGSSLYHVCLGNVSYARGNMEETLREMKRAIEIDPDEELAHLCLGSIFERINDYELSISNYSRFVELSGDEPKKAFILDRIRQLRLLLDNKQIREL